DCRSQRVEQILRRAQIARLEPLCERAVDAGELAARLIAPAAISEKPREARGRAKLERLLGAPAREIDRVAERSLDVRGCRGSRAQRNLTVEPQQLRSEERTAMLLADGRERVTSHLR